MGLSILLVSPVSLVYSLLDIFVTSDIKSGKDVPYFLVGKMYSIIQSRQL